MKKSELQFRATDELIPYAGNARTHPERQVEQICESIRQYGFYNPVLIDESGIIIAGHGRVMAAKRMNLDTIPTMVIYGLTEIERRTLTFADNKIAMNSSWDMEKVREELSELASMDVDLDVTGFDGFEIEAYLRDDLDIMHPDMTTSFVPTVPVSGSASVGTQGQSITPRASDDDFSRFDLVMQHGNKRELVELLDSIRTDKQLDKLEDALMELVKLWKETNS